MKGHLIWITGGIASVALAVPAFAALQSPDLPAIDDTPTSVTVSTTDSSVPTSVSVPTTDSSVPTSVSVPTSDPGDISGPCDELEHVNDPRCTGAVDSDDDDSDNSGPGNQHDDDSDSDSDNSGHGSND